VDIENMIAFRRKHFDEDLKLKTLMAVYLELDPWPQKLTS
jgi:hypothetical protein